MKKVACILEENFKNYLLTFYLIKVKGKRISVINKIPCSIDKIIIKNNDEKYIRKHLKELYKMINNELLLNKFNNANCVIGNNLYTNIRDKYMYPNISKIELKKIIDLEINKKYGSSEITYLKINKIDKKFKVNIIIQKKAVKTLIDEMFNNIHLKLKKTLFLPEAIDKLIKPNINMEFKKTINQNNNYLFIYESDNNYILNVVIDNEIEYTCTHNKKDNLTSKLLSIYGYYSNELNHTVYVSLLNDKKFIEENNIGLKIIEISPNTMLEIESLINKYEKNDYEKL